MSNYNEGSTFDRDDNALVAESTGVRGAGVPSANPDDVGETTPGIADTTAGAVDAADAEFAASGGTSELDADASAAESADDSGPSEPDDRFVDDQSSTVGAGGSGGTAAASTSPDADQVGAASRLQPETQGIDAIYAELGDEGQGDLSPEDQM